MGQERHGHKRMGHNAQETHNKAFCAMHVLFLRHPSPAHTEGKIALGMSSPPYPALVRHEPTSSTIELTSSVCDNMKPPGQGAISEQIRYQPSHRLRIGCSSLPFDPVRSGGVQTRTRAPRTSEDRLSAWLYVRDLALLVRHPGQGNPTQATPTHI